MVGAQGALRNEPPHPISGLPAPQSGAKHLGVPGDPCLPSPCPAGCPDSWHGSAGLGCPGPGHPPRPVPQLPNAARSYRGNWKNTGRPPHPPASAARAAAALRLGPAAWAALAPGGEAGAAARLSAGAGAGSCVSGSRPSPPPPPPAGPPAAAARPPRGLAGCRLPRRGFAPFSRPLRLPELIWELFISCQKAAGPAERATLAAGPPGFGPGVAALGRSRPARLAPRGLPGTPSHPGRARGGGASPAHLVALRSPEEASRGLLPARGCGES